MVSCGVVRTSPAVSAAFAALTLSGALAACAEDPPVVAPDAGVVDGDAGPRFRAVEIPALPSPAPNFFDVWGTSRTDVWLVGSSGTIVHYDGTAWVQEPTDTQVALRAVHGLARTDAGVEVYAVGDEGVTLTRGADGAWTTDASTTTEDLRDLVGRDGPDAELWAVGANGTILRRDLSPAMPGAPTAWARVRSNTRENLGGAWISGDGDVVAVGNLGVIMRGSATDAFMRQRIDGLVSPLVGVWGVAPDRLYFVGLDGKIVRQEGREISELPDVPAVYLRRLVGPSFDRFWVTGWGGTLVSVEGGRATSYADFTDNRLEGIWLTTRDEPDPSTDGGVRSVPEYWVTGVSGKVLVGP